MSPDEAREEAMLFIAAYDTPDSGDYGRHIVRLARSWMRMLNADYSLQAMVDRIMAELEDEPPPHYGHAWYELRKKFTSWAVANEWWNV